MSLESNKSETDSPRPPDRRRSWSIALRLVLLFTVGAALLLLMKMNTLEKAHTALLNLDPEIILPEQLRKRAETPILRMLELSR